MASDLTISDYENKLKELKKKRRIEKQKEYIDNNFKRMTVTVPIAIYEIIQEQKAGVSLNKYINDLIKQDLKIE